MITRVTCELWQRNYNGVCDHGAEVLSHLVPIDKKETLEKERRLADGVADEIFGFSPGSTGVLLDILHERFRQNLEWGVQNHTQMVWLGILAEEFGEAAKEINELHFRSDDPSGLTPHARLHRVREELVKVAAVAVAMIESLDRNGK